MADTETVLFVDLTTGDSRVDEIDMKGALGLGGKVLGIRLIEKYLEIEVDPLAPENVLALTPSPLAAYGMSGSDRFGAFTKSPLTGIWLEAYCGGSFARTLRETGWGAVVITGAAPAPVRLHVTAEGARLQPATDLWGKDTFAVEAELLARLDKRSSVLCIGVAGENLVKIASVMHERAHTLGRGGMGAVFGSKKLKAVSVTSPGPVKMEAQEQFVQTRREISKLAMESPTSTNYQRFGTPVMVALAQRGRDLPHRLLHEERGTAPGHPGGRALAGVGHARERYLPPLPPALPQAPHPDRGAGGRARAPRSRVRDPLRVRRLLHGGARPGRGHAERALQHAGHGHHQRWQPGCHRHQGQAAGTGGRRPRTGRRRGHQSTPR